MLGKNMRNSFIKLRPCPFYEWVTAYFSLATLQKCQVFSGLEAKTHFTFHTHRLIRKIDPVLILPMSRICCVHLWNLYCYHVISDPLARREWVSTGIEGSTRTTTHARSYLAALATASHGRKPTEGEGSLIKRPFINLFVEKEPIETVATKLLTIPFWVLRHSKWCWRCAHRESEGSSTWAWWGSSPATYNAPLPPSSHRSTRTHRLAHLLRTNVFQHFFSLPIRGERCSAGKATAPQSSLCQTGIFRLFLSKRSHHKGPCSWQKTGRGQHCGLARQSISQRKHLCSRRHWQNLDMPCQRTETASFSWTFRWFLSTAPAATTNRMSSIGLDVFVSQMKRDANFFSEKIHTFGSTPVGLWAQACKTTTAPSCIFCKNELHFVGQIDVTFSIVFVAAKIKIGIDEEKSTCHWLNTETKQCWTHWEIFHGPIEVETTSFRIIISVAVHMHTRMPEEEKATLNWETWKNDPHVNFPGVGVGRTTGGCFQFCYLAHSVLQLCCWWEGLHMSWKRQKFQVSSKSIMIAECPKRSRQKTYLKIGLWFPQLGVGR